MPKEVHYQDKGRVFELFGKTYKWVMGKDGYELKKVAKKNG